MPRTLPQLLRNALIKGQTAAILQNACVAYNLGPNRRRSHVDDKILPKRLKRQIRGKNKA